MGIAIFIVGLFAAIGTVITYVPPRRDLVSSFVFTIGWLTSELSLQLALVLTGGWLVVAFTVGIHGVFALAGSLLLAGAVVGDLCLHVIAHRSSHAVEEGLRSATPEPIALDPSHLAPNYGNFFRRTLAFPLPLRSVELLTNIDYVGDGRKQHRLDVYRSKRESDGLPRPVVLYIHGGAWLIGDKREQAKPMLFELAARGWLCLSVNYSLSPKATWPEHVVDCKRAIAWAKDHVAEFGGDPSLIVLAGGSAGGHLASLCALTPGAPEFQPGFESADTAVQGCISIYGVLEMTGDKESSGRHGDGLLHLLERQVMKTTLANERTKFEGASPLHRVTPTAPPFLVLQGRNDTLVPVEVARQFVSRYRATATARCAYVELPFAQHAFDIFSSPRCTATTAGVVAFLAQLRRDAAVR